MFSMFDYIKYFLEFQNYSKIMARYIDGIQTCGLSWFFKGKICNILGAINWV